jgi:hypothetical protein
MVAKIKKKKKLWMENPRAAMVSRVVSRNRKKSRELS